jgi:hypothetical protein
MKLERAGRFAACCGLAALALWPAGCVRPPDPYPPPPQRTGLAPLEIPFGSFVNMSDASAGAYFVQDVSPKLEANAWRWTFEKPTLRFYLPDTADFNFTMEFAIPGVTLAHTGPLVLTVVINGHTLERRTYSKDGQYSIRKPVPAEWLMQGSENLVEMYLDKHYVTESDKVKLGFILTRAGFVK